MSSLFQPYQGSQNSFSQNFSLRVILLRFPLLLLIIAIHARFAAPHSLVFDSVFLPKFLHTAVPFFFLISGTFLTLKLQGEEKLNYRNMLKKKIFTLLLPYVIWNVLYGFPHLVLPLMMKSSSFLPVAKYDEMNLFQIFLRTFGLNGEPPIDVPLWYVRNLMVFFLLAPLLIALMRRLPVWVSLPLLVVLDIAPPITGISYFMLGILLGIHKPSLAWVDRGGLLWLICIPLLPLCHTWTDTWQLAGISGGNFRWTIFCLNAALLFYAASNWLRKAGLPSIVPLIFLSDGSFFVFCLHAPVTTTLARLFYRSPLGKALPELTYLVTIFTATVFCYATYFALRKAIPPVFRLLNGQRPVRGKTVLLPVPNDGKL